MAAHPINHHVSMKGTERRWPSASSESGVRPGHRRRVAPVVSDPSCRSCMNSHSTTAKGPMGRATRGPALVYKPGLAVWWERAVQVGVGGAGAATPPGDSYSVSHRCGVES